MTSAWVSTYSGEMELRFEDVSKRFGEATAFEIPSLRIRSGELFTFVGPSGSGKSSVLKVIAGIEPPSSGTLLIGDQALSEQVGDSRGVVLVAAANLLDPGPQEVSLFDDPLCEVEAAERERQRAAFARLHSELRKTFIYATQDQAEALAISDRIAVLHNGQIQQVGTPTEIFDVPANTFVASYFGAPPMNVVTGILEKDGQAVDVGNRAIQLGCMVRDSYARDVSLGIRPEHVRLRSADQPGWRGRVARVDRVGDRTSVEVRVDMASFVAHADSDQPYEPGDIVTIMLSTKHLHVFDVRGSRLETT